MKGGMSVLLSFCLLMSSFMKEQSMLYQADRIADKYTLAAALSPPPLLAPQPQSCLDAANIWFTIDLSNVAVSDKQTVFQRLSDPELWTHLRDLGVQAIHLKGLKTGGNLRTALGVDPCFGNLGDWENLFAAMQRKGLLLIADSVGRASGQGPDFQLALQNQPGYPGLFHLIEIPKYDWKSLPLITNGQFAVNIPWLTLQELHKKGYVPQAFSPYMKESAWNATREIQGVDGIVRRWIYLKQNRADPVLDWLTPNLAGVRLAMGDALDSIYNLGCKVLQCSSGLSLNARETLALSSRKIGAFTVQEIDGGIGTFLETKSDLMIDTLTRPALLHALIAQDAEALKIAYRLFLEEGIEAKRFVHVLQPFDEFACDWTQLLCDPKRKFTYYEERLTGEALRQLLIAQDIINLGEKQIDRVPLCTWPGYCGYALGVKDLQAAKSEVENAHLLLAFFYAMQPGAFSFSAEDLLGALPEKSGPLDLMGPNLSTLYASLPMQLKNSSSFASRLKKIIDARRENGLESAELAEVPKTVHKSALLLAFRMKRSSRLAILAVNFGKNKVEETLDSPAFRRTTMIDLMTGQAEPKPLDSSVARIHLPPLTGKIFLFQPQYYD